MDGMQSSVLFDGSNVGSQYGYNAQSGDNLQWYSGSASGLGGNLPPEAYGSDFAREPQFDGRVDWRAAFGTGGFANEPPLLEGWRQSAAVPETICKL